MNFKAIAKALTAIDKKSWVVVKENSLDRSDGLSLWVREGGYGNEGKAVIHFDRPIGRDGRAPTIWMKSPGTGKVSNPSINVSLTKSPEQMAKDILRRLLPESEIVFKLACESIANENKYLDGKEKTLFAIAAICGTEPERNHYSKELTGEVDPFKGAVVVPFGQHGYGKIKVSSADSVDISLTSVGVNTAMEIVSAITKILRNKKE